MFCTSKAEMTDFKLCNPYRVRSNSSDTQNETNDLRMEPAQQSSQDYDQIGVPLALFAAGAKLRDQLN